VIEVEYLECAGSNAVAVVKLKKRDPDDGKRALRLLAEKFMGKMLVAVDEDIEVRDPRTCCGRSPIGRNPTRTRRWWKRRRSRSMGCRN
jgi:hypothetical protein